MYLLIVELAQYLLVVRWVDAEPETPLRDFRESHSPFQCTLGCSRTTSYCAQTGSQLNMTHMQRYILSYSHTVYTIAQ